MAKIDDATIQELKAKHKNLFLLPGWEFVCRLPTIQEAETFLQSKSSGDDSLDGFRELVTSCTVFPEADKVSAVFEEFAFAPVSIGNAISSCAKLQKIRAVETKGEGGRRLFRLIDQDGDEYVCRLPTSAEAERFLQNGSGKNGLDAFRGLAISCVVAPFEDKMNAIADEYAFVVVSISNKLSELARLEEKTIAKKL
jgi:hypothetical protein